MKLKHRAYTTVVPFISDLGNVFVSVLSRPTWGDGQKLQEHSFGISHSALDTREVRKLAKRISKAVQPMLQDVAEKESSLIGIPYIQHDIPQLETILDQIMAKIMKDTQDHQGNERVRAATAADADAVTELSADGAKNLPCIGTATILSDSAPHPKEESHSNHPWINRSDDGASTLPSPEHSQNTIIEHQGKVYSDTHSTIRLPKEIGVQVEGTSSDRQVWQTQENALQNGDKVSSNDPLTPPCYDHDASSSFDYGGMPWYVEEFDICGTTLHEERWTGRDVVRGMSEELSEIDDEDLQDMREDMAENGAVDEAQAEVKAATKIIAAKRRRKAWRRYR